MKEWSWESFWLVQGIFAWIVFPWLGASLALPEGVTLGALWAAGGAWQSVFYGVLWGVGGLTFGLSMRYLGVALGQSIALGTCAAFGTLFPALLAVWPYGLLAIALFEEGSAGSVVFFWVYCALTAALVLFQILYCCLHRASARTFAFWDLTVKLCHIPFYLAAFALGVLMMMAMVVPALLFVSPAVNLLLLAVDTALMLTSSAYGIRAAVSGLSLIHI